LYNILIKLFDNKYDANFFKKDHASKIIGFIKPKMLRCSCKGPITRR